MRFLENHEKEFQAIVILAWLDNRVNDTYILWQAYKSVTKGGYWVAVFGRKFLLHGNSEIELVITICDFQF